MARFQKATRKETLSQRGRPPSVPHLPPILLEFIVDEKATIGSKSHVVNGVRAAEKYNLTFDLYTRGAEGFEVMLQRDFAQQGCYRPP